MKLTRWKATGWDTAEVVQLSTMDDLALAIGYMLIVIAGALAIMVPIIAGSLYLMGGL